MINNIWIECFFGRDTVWNSVCQHYVSNIKAVRHTSRKNILLSSMSLLIVNPIEPVNEWGQERFEYSGLISQSWNLSGAHSKISHESRISTLRYPAWPRRWAFDSKISKNTWYSPKNSDYCSVGSESPQTEKIPQKRNSLENGNLYNYLTLKTDPPPV